MESIDINSIKEAGVLLVAVVFLWRAWTKSRDENRSLYERWIEQLSKVEEKDEPGN